MRWLMSILMGCLLTSCATVPRAPTVGKQTVVERSVEKTPAWITQTFWEEKKVMYFSGGVRNVPDYALGLRQAKAEAVKNIVESIKTKARTEFESALLQDGKNVEELGGFVSDVVAMVADNVEVGGMLPKENYYEKVEQITASGVKYFYNCYSLLQLPAEDYKLARRKALEQVTEKARTEKDAKAEETAKSLMKRLVGE